MKEKKEIIDFCEIKTHCPYCKSTNVEPTGVIMNGNKDYYCNDCNNTFYENN